MANVSGGAPPYAWSNGNSGKSINAGAGAYSVTATDANGCMLVLGFNIDEPDPLTASLDVMDIFATITMPVPLR